MQIIHNMQRVMQALGAVHATVQIKSGYLDWPARKAHLDIVMDLRSALSHSVTRFWQHYETLHASQPDQMDSILEELYGELDIGSVHGIERLLPHPAVQSDPKVATLVAGTTFDRTTGIVREIKQVGTPYNGNKARQKAQRLWA